MARMLTYSLGPYAIFPGFVPVPSSASGARVSGPAPKCSLSRVWMRSESDPDGHDVPSRASRLHGERSGARRHVEHLRARNNASELEREARVARELPPQLRAVPFAHEIPRLGGHERAQGWCARFRHERVFEPQRKHVDCRA